MSSIRTPSRTSSTDSGPDLFLEFDGAYSIYESELEPGHTTCDDEEGPIHHEVDGQEDGVINMGKHLSKRERVKKWLRRVLRCWLPSRRAYYQG
jgi:hypothetical protein